MRAGRTLRVVTALVCLIPAGLSYAQRGGRAMGGEMGAPPGGMGGPPGGAGGMGGPGMGDPGRAAGGMAPRPNVGTNDSAIRAGVQLGPPMRWWDDKSWAKAVKLRPEQKTKMDSIFDQNRGVLVAKLQTLQQAEGRMNELSQGDSPDEAAIFQQIDRVSEAHADLEKATTHLWLQIRREMDPDQIKRLEAQR